jgi:hypothetical protein
MPAEVVLRALRHAWECLRPLDVPVAVAGGIALSAWKYIRATRDIDLLLAVEEKRSPELLSVLGASGIRLKRDLPAIKLGQLDVIQLLYEPPEAFMDVQIDLLLARSPYHLQALQRRTVTRLPELDVEVAVLTCEDLILHKLLAGRIIDRADAAALLRINRRSLDRDYLRLWTARLSLSRELAEIWREALPDEPFPGVARPEA